MPFIVIAKRSVNNAEQFQTTEIAGDTLRIGRGTSNDLHLEDATVQLNHALIQQTDDHYVLRDLNSLSLTTVNDQAVKELILPDRGDIRIGSYVLHFSRPAPGSLLTIEYDIPEETVTTAVVADQALEPTVVQEIAGQPTEPVSPRRPARDEKVHLVANYGLRTRSINKTTITVIALLAVLGGSALAYAVGKHQIFSPGSISMKHREKGNQCSACHTVAWKPILTVVPNAACLNCHKPLAKAEHFGDRSLGPIPQCASCHAEHKGQAILSMIPDSRCVQCHTNLMAKEGGLQFAGHVHSFTADHPEFSVTVSHPDQPIPARVRLDDTARLEDTAAIKLNHKLHLKPELPGSEGFEQLTCASCHKLDAQGAYMLPIKYETACVRCHTLDFDDRFPGKPAPHGKQLDEVDQFLRATYADYYLSQHKAELQATGMVRRLPGAQKSREEMWIDDMVVRAERFLLGKPDPKTKQGKCVLCHSLERKADVAGALKASLPGSRPQFPTVLKTSIPERWLPYSIFNHVSHLSENFAGKSIDEKCIKCHEAAPHSEQTKDVLLPNVASCRKCHIEPNGVRAECITCHLYHDKNQARKLPQSPHASLIPSPVGTSSGP